MSSVPVFDISILYFITSPVFTVWVAFIILGFFITEFSGIDVNNILFEAKSLKEGELTFYDRDEDKDNQQTNPSASAQTMTEEKEKSDADKKGE